MEEIPLSVSDVEEPISQEATGPGQGTVIEVKDPTKAGEHEAEPADAEGRLLIRGEVARGGMGVILLGRDQRLGRELAVKVLQERHLDHPEMIQRFLAEARIAGQLQHPGIVPVHELGNLPDGRPYFTMRLVKGRTLAELLASRDDPTADRARLITILLQIAQTVAYAHSLGVIHLDLKPANIMVGRFGEVQVMDWGLATLLPGRPGSPPEVEDRSTPSRMGTPGYMSPEQRSGTEPVDERSDVFALGAILSEILNDQPLGDGNPSRMVLPPVGTVEDDDDLVGLARECLSNDPTERPPNAEAVARRLADHLETLEHRLRKSELDRVEAQARAREERTRRRLSGLLALLVVGTAAFGIVVAADRWRREQARRFSDAQVLRELKGLIDAAEADPGGGIPAWRRADRFAERAAQILGAADPEDLGFLERLATDASVGLRRAEADRQLLQQLEQARFLADDFDYQAANATFSRAFVEAGLDLLQAGPQSLGRAVAERPDHVRAELLAGLDTWSAVSRSVPRDDGQPATHWRAILEVAQAADVDRWRGRVRNALAKRDQSALRRLADQPSAKGQPAVSRWLLGRSLFWTGDLPKAIAANERALRAYPGDFWLHLDQSLYLSFEPSRPDLALAHATAAIAIRPRSAVAHVRLGVAWEKLGDLEAAEASYRDAIRLDPGLDPAWSRLAFLLHFGLGKLEEAVEAYRASTPLQSIRAASGHTLAGDALRSLGRLDESEREFLRATKLQPNRWNSWKDLGDARVLLRDRAGASAAFDRAEALISPDSDEAERLAESRQCLDDLDRLDGLLSGETPFRDLEDRLRIAKFCGRIGQAVDGVRLYDEAIQADPSLADNRTRRIRENAALLAAWAGTGRSADTPDNLEARARLRLQALDWLNAELAAWASAIDSGTPRDRGNARAALRRWSKAHELADVRDPEALDAMPEEERARWRAFWDEVDRQNSTDEG